LGGELMSAENATQAENYGLLLEHFEPHILFDNVTPATHRYAAVSEEFFDETRVGALVFLCETQQEAFEVLGGSVLDGYAPDGVYDLETGEKIEVHVSTPIIRRAEDQGTTLNPLGADWRHGQTVDSARIRSVVIRSQVQRRASE
jgi:hypothetical protein